jgi:hypothetical protein
MGPQKNPLSNYVKHLRIAILLGILLPFTTVWAKMPVRDFALSLRKNVVSLDVQWHNGNRHEGFGFVIGEMGGGLLLVTANSLLRGDLPGDLAKYIRVKSFQEQGNPREGLLLEFNDKTYNLAVIAAASFDYEKSCIGCSSAVVPFTPAWYVGRAGTWHAPDQAGKIRQRFVGDKAWIDGLNLDSGSLGAPVFIESGMIGMVSSVRPGETQIVSMDRISKAFQAWALPWHLTRALDQPCRRWPWGERISDFPGTEEGLKATIEELFQPGVSWWDTILHKLVPDDRDFDFLFGEESAKEKGLGTMNYLLASGLLKGAQFDGGVWYAVEDIQSSSTDPMTRRDWVPAKMGLRTGLRVYRCKIGSEYYSGFFFVNGHWVYLPLKVLF